MRDPQRIDRIVNKLRAKWHEYPDLRLGQLVENIATQNVFYVEDDQFERKLDKYPN